MTRPRRQRVPGGGYRQPERTRHGISYVEVELILRRQGGGCAICGGPADEHPWEVEHDHVEAALHPHPVNVGCPDCIRGITHRAHNLMLAYAGDDPAILRAGAEYLERWKARRRRR